MVNPAELTLQQSRLDAHNCDHAHCPHGCEHPQPMMDGSDLICMRCARVVKVRTVMVPCTPEAGCWENHEPLSNP